ncbi:MAG: MerR family transcriptional regulator [Candidatus Kapaibacterium sp.]|nr:MAG: MerR family transcriptional regulator [Candidatus Kapabacteria bacterium]
MRIFYQFAWVLLLFSHLYISFTVEAQSSIKRLYYSISEASQLVDEEQYVLRYWETEFEQLRPQKNRAGNRIYTNKEIDLLRAIKHLLREKRYTVDGAKEHLKQFSGSEIYEYESSALQPSTTADNTSSYIPDSSKTNGKTHSPTHTTNGKGETGEGETGAEKTSPQHSSRAAFSHEELLALRSTLREILDVLESPLRV